MTISEFWIPLRVFLRCLLYKLKYISKQMSTNAERITVKSFAKRGRKNQSESHSNCWVWPNVWWIFHLFLETFQSTWRKSSNICPEMKFIFGGDRLFRVGLAIAIGFGFRSPIRKSERNQWLPAKINFEWLRGDRSQRGKEPKL